MSFTLELANFSSEQVAFGYSAAHEAVVALHVFHDCKHHPLHLSWVLQARRRLSPALKEEIEAFRFFYRRPIVAFWELQEGAAFRSFEQEVDELMQAPIAGYAEKTLHMLLERSVSWAQWQQADAVIAEEVLARVRERHPGSLAVVGEFLRDPWRSRARFVEMLCAFWEACVREEWPRIEELFVLDITERGRALLRGGVLGVLEGLAPEISVNRKRQTATIRRISKAELTFGEQDVLFLEPSYFTWPHLFVKRTKPVILHYSVMELQQAARPEMPPEHLYPFFRALGDLTRLQIVQYLAQKERSTRELAELIGITEAAVSKHLKQLLAAGLVTARRESYYVFYRLLEQPFADLPSGLQTLLRG